MARAFLILAIWITLIGPASAADQRALVKRIAAEFIVPRYQALFDASERQRTAWQRFCADPSAAGGADLESAFHAAADAWSSIEFLRFGPITSRFRHERVAHWPERRNAVGRALANLLTSSETDILTEERFAGSSVAGQGLTALERLLFDDGSMDKLLRGTEAPVRCAIGTAIGRSLARVSGSVLREWTEADGVLASLTVANDAAITEALTRIATDLLSLYQLVGDHKLGAVMGREPGEARVALAEGRRSRRSTRAIVLNLESAHSLTRIVLDADDDPVLDSLDLALRLARNLPPEFAVLADDPKQRTRLVLLRDTVWGAQQRAEATIPSALGITLGFNSLDGD